MFKFWLNFKIKLLNVNAYKYLCLYGLYKVLQPSKYISNPLSYSVCCCLKVTVLTEITCLSSSLLLFLLFFLSVCYPLLSLSSSSPAAAPLSPNCSSGSATLGLLLSSAVWGVFKWVRVTLTHTLFFSPHFKVSFSTWLRLIFSAWHLHLNCLMVCNACVCFCVCPLTVCLYMQIYSTLSTSSCFSEPGK